MNFKDVWDNEFEERLSQMNNKEIEYVFKFPKKQGLTKEQYIKELKFRKKVEFLGGDIEML